MKKIAIFSFTVSILLCVTPALATALKSLDGRLLFVFGPRILESEPAYMILLGASMLAIAGFTRRKIER